jgi:hypothetical protein
MGIMTNPAIFVVDDDQDERRMVALDVERRTGRNAVL